MEGTAESQAELEPRLRGRARPELGLKREEPGLEARGGWKEWKQGAERKRRRLAAMGPGPGQEPGAPALDLVSCSPGQQLEGRRERTGGGRHQGENRESESEGR